MNNKIDIIGPYPPPYGGVSIHISRLLPIMRAEGLNPIIYNQYDYENTNLNIIATNKKPTWWISYIFKRKSAVVHFHQFSFLHFPYVLLLSWLSNKKFIISIHNEKILNSSAMKRQFIFALLKLTRLARLIVVSKTLYQTMSTNNINHVEWLPAYVPPSQVTKLPLPGSYSLKVAFNAAQLSDFKSVEVYGADHLFLLAKEHPLIGFYLFIGDPSSKNYIEQYLLDSNIKNCVVFYGEPMVNYLSDANLFLRLNRQDAYGISIQEALDLGVPALASDVCTRATGCILYETGNYNNLSKVFINTLAADPKELLKTREPVSYHLRLISLYKELLVQARSK